MSSEQPLSPYRVLEIASGAGAFCGRVLADLGADVVKLEPPSGDPMRRQPPLAGDTGIAFLWYNANKRGLTLDLDDPACQERVAGALADFDILIDGNPPGWLATRGLGPADLRGRHPHLIVTSVTHFGQDGPYRDWHGSSLVDFAIAGSLLRCGVPEAPPCAPPYELSYAITGITAASATLLALFERGRSGDGDWIDCSVVEAVQAQGDWSVPNYGASGATQKRAGAGPLFRLYRAADGWVRVINLSPKQWRSFRAWLGDPPEVAGPEWENPLYRGANQSILDEICNRKFAGRTKADLFFDGQRAGVGIVPIYDPAEVMADAHFRERGTFVPFATPAGEARAPGAFVRMADHPPGSPRPAPSPGADESVLAGPRAAAGGQGGDGRLPLAGLRVIEVGSGAVAPEITRILGEFGADVIKLESMMQVDFMRLMGQPGSVEASPGYASSNRSKRSLALNLKHPEANRLAQALADKADVIVENNTAGVMSRLGLDYPTLAARNPRLIYLSSQAFGATGPASSFGGFGPTNQAISATTYLWNHPDCDEPQGTQVIHPDHL
ncbi:MAG TPA: CoA transferase, partial [Dehalococcoidia bacterium]|nr:CoA transferase [Dehalococcoidia bacterium]